MNATPTRTAMSIVARTPQSNRPARIVMVLAAVSVLAGCSDASDMMAPSYRPVPVAPSAMRVEVVATVDLEAGTMTFEPTTGASRSLGSSAGLSAAIYGNQGVTVRLYNTPVVVSPSATPGKKQFSALVGVKNLLSYPIGDEQGGDAPLDTIGIDVFIVQEPAVISTSSVCTPACTVTLLDHHGARAFTAPNQKYWHWNDRLGAFGSGTDTTRTRTRFTFEVDTQVTNFTFGVVVNAPWPAPYESRFRVDYPADALPTAGVATPWRLLQVGAANAPIMSDGLVLDPQSGQISYYRLDSLGSTQSAYFEARVELNSVSPQNSNTAEARIVLVDGVKYIGLGVFSSGVGFVNPAHEIVGTKLSLVTSTPHIYQLRKYAADSVVYYVDGTRRGNIAYAALPASPYGTATRVEFGAVNSKRQTTSTWDFVTYELGVATP